MKIKTRLLIQVAILIVPLVVNLLILSSLGLIITRTTQNMIFATHQQAAALRMRAQLRDAEAALYRYQIEGEEGFAVQFENQLHDFEQETGLLEADSPQSIRWQDVLTQAHQQALNDGRKLINSRDTLRQDLQSLKQSQLQIEMLLADIQAVVAGDPEYQEITNGLLQDTREMSFAVASYMIRPDEEQRILFSDSAIALHTRAVQLSDLTTPEVAETLSRLDGLFAQAEQLGSQLINEQDRQQILFAQFAASIFELDWQTISGEIQPYFAQYLHDTQNLLLTTLAAAIVTSAVISLGSVVLAVVFALRNMRHITSGIQVLVQASDRIAQGIFSDPVRLHRRDELHYLGDAFNLMMKELAERQRRLQVRISELEALRDIGIQLTSVLDIEQVLQTIVDSALKLVQASETHIFLHNAGSHAPELNASAYRNRSAPRPFQYDAALVLDVMSTRHAQVTRPGYRGATGKSSTPEDSHAAAAIPLMLADNLLGVFYIILDDRDTFQAEELRILHLLNDQAAVALENARLYRNVADNEIRLHNLLHKLAIVQEEERRLVGLDLHDGLTQTLLSANMHLSTLGAVATDLDNQAQVELGLCQSRLQESIAEVRWVISELRPIELEDFGLVDGLRRYINKVAQTVGWDAAFMTDLSNRSFDPAMETAVFRIVQEALSNARKYARTPKVNVRLQVIDNRLVTEIKDWGSGFDPARLHETETLGLLGMRERAELFGGELHIESAQGRGTSIMAVLPID